VNRRVLFIAFVGFVLASAFLAFHLTQSEPKHPVPAAQVERSAPRPAVIERKPEPMRSEPAPVRGQTPR